MRAARDQSRAHLATRVLTSGMIRVGDSVAFGLTCLDLNRDDRHCSTGRAHPRIRAVGSAYYPVLVAIFTSLVIISNIAATKGVAFGPIITDGGFIVFPITYVIGDVLAEVYGFRAARRAILTGFVMNGVAALALVGDRLPPGSGLLSESGAPGQRGRCLHATDRRGNGRFHRGPNHQRLGGGEDQGPHQERHLWARLVGSTFAGQLGDTLVFCAIAASAIGISSARDFVVYTGAGLGLQDRRRSGHAAGHLPRIGCRQTTRAQLHRPRVMPAAATIHEYGDRAPLIECTDAAEVIAVGHALRAADLPEVSDIVPGARTVLVRPAPPACRRCVTASQPSEDRRIGAHPLMPGLRW